MNAEPPGPDWLRKRIGIAFFAKPRSVKLVPLVNDISPLAGMYEIEELHLERPSVRDVKPLRNPRKLRHLFELSTNYRGDAADETNET